LTAFARFRYCHCSMRLLVAGAIAKSLLRFRGALLETLTALGHEVHTCSGEPDRTTTEALSERGIFFHPVPLERSGTNLVDDARYALALRSLLRAVDPELVLSYTLKPAVYASLAAQERGIRAAAMITGAGQALTTGGGLSARTVAAGLRRLLAFSLSSCEVVFFQNPDDLREFVGRGLASERQSVLLDGSGVDIEEFRATEPPLEPLRFLTMARLLRDKGILDYAEAARRLRVNAGVRFSLLGPREPGSRGLTDEELDFVQSCSVEYLGEAEDVRPYLQACSAFVLASYYREGQPRSVLEALASGRAVITTDAPGCRETVQPGYNGFLVPPRRPDLLAQAMQRFVDDRSLVTRMGAASRRVAELRYDVRRVNAVIIEALGLARSQRRPPSWGVA
jgi:glycosyltransferase involved in cell wall biosynthesis